MIKRAAKREEGDFYETQELPETKQIAFWLIIEMQPKHYF